MEALLEFMYTMYITMYKVLQMHQELNMWMNTANFDITKEPIRQAFFFSLSAAGATQTLTLWDNFTSSFFLNHPINANVNCNYVHKSGWPIETFTSLAYPHIKHFNYLWGKQVLQSFPT